MKRLIYILIIGLVVLLCSYSLFGDGEEVSKKINQSICLGQSGAIAEYFAPEVSLDYLGSESMCSKGQTEVVLREFFRQNRPSQFLSTTGSGLITGNLTTTSGKLYRVRYILKNVDNKEVITCFCIN